MRFCLCFFFSSRRRHTRCSRDWSSDVCSSDLRQPAVRAVYLYRVLEPPQREPGASLAGSARLRRRLVAGARRHGAAAAVHRSEEHTSELQSRLHLVCRLLLEKKKTTNEQPMTT